MALQACQPLESDAIRFGLASAPINLDPRLATDASSERINRLLYQSLVGFDEQLRPVPALADWDRLAADHYRFTLHSPRPSFHNGRTLDADDVAATFRSILDPETRSPQRKTLALIRQIKVLDEDRLDFYLSRPDPLFPAYLTAGIVPAESVADQTLAREPVGSGPFRLLAWPQPGKLELQRRRDGQRLIFERVSDPTMRVLKLLRGEIDLLQNDLPPELLAWLASQAEIRVRRRPGSNFTYLGLNLEDAQLRTPAVRRAIALAIDRQAIIRYIFADAAREASALLPPSHWAGGRALASIQRDLPRARRLLQEAGYSAANPLRLVYKTSSDPLRIRIATVLQQQLADAGIDVSVRSYDWGTFYGDIKAGRFQLFSLSWVGVRTPDIFHYVFHSEALPPQGANRGRLRSAQVDRLIERAEQAQDMQLKARLYQQLQALLLELLPYVPLWYEDQFVALRDNIKGYRLAPDGNYDALINTVKSPVRRGEQTQ